MAKFDPIERLPDGALFRLTPGQARSVRSLTKRCCNYTQGDCLLLDGVCPQSVSRSLICRWFRHAVLPEQPKLERAILSPKQLHRGSPPDGRSSHAWPGPSGWWNPPAAARPDPSGGNTPP